MKVETKLTIELYRSAIITMYFKSIRSKIYLVLGIFMILMYIMSLVVQSEETETPLVALILGIVWLVGLPLLYYYMAKRQFVNSERLHEAITYEFTEEQIKIQGESFYSEMDWKKVYKIIETKQWIFIYQNKMIANIIPVASFGNRLQAFKALASKHNLKLKFLK